MISSFLIQAICYSNIIALLTISLTLTYMTTKVPNFMQGSFAMVGTYVATGVYYLLHIHPYYSLPIECAIGALVGIAVYYLIIRPLIKRGASVIMLMIATFAGDFVLCGLLFIYANYLQDLGIQVRPLWYAPDFTIAGVPLLLIFSLLSIVVLYILLFTILYKTKFGTAVRAAVENPSLAQTLGVNLEAVRVFSWALSGLLSAYAGVLWPLILSVRITDPSYGSAQLPLIFASSIVGGLDSLIGAIIGGYIIGFSQIYLPYLTGYTELGYVFPLIIMVIVLLICPKGVGDLIERAFFGKKAPTRRV